MTKASMKILENKLMQYAVMNFHFFLNCSTEFKELLQL
jgi:hypothetical protein